MSQHNHRFTAVLAAAAVAAFSGVASGRPDYCEMGDAGEGPMSAQSTSGTGPLESIIGTLQSPIAGGDEDVFVIRISDPAAFSATTFGDGSADFDAQLWLFFAEPGFDGLGALGNDDTSVLPPEDARIVQTATDTTMFSVTAPGLYYLAISAKGDDPRSASGEIFNFLLPLEISGPDGVGSGDPLIDWTQSMTDDGAYQIAITGAEFAELPASIPTVGGWALIIMTLLLVTGVTLVARARQRAGPVTT